MTATAEMPQKKLASGDLQKRIWQGIRIVFLTVLVVWSLFPIVWNVLTSLKSRRDIFSDPPTFLFPLDFTGYSTSLTTGAGSVYPSLINSLAVSVGTTVVCVVIGVLGSFAFARYRFRGRIGLLIGIMASRLLPPIAAVVPLYMLFNGLGWLDTYRSLILIYSAMHVPLAIWLLKGFVETIPRELEEAAAMEGCNVLQLMRHITFPLLAPGIATTAAFVFVVSWNEFMFAFMFTATNARTLPVQLTEIQGESIFLWQQMAAQSTILMIPPFILALYLQKYLVKGLTSGAVK